MFTEDELYSIYFVSISKRENYRDWWSWLAENYRECCECFLYDVADCNGKVQARGDDDESEWYVCDDCWPAALAKEQELNAQMEELHWRMMKLRLEYTDILTELLTTPNTYQENT